MQIELTPNAGLHQLVNIKRYPTIYDFKGDEAKQSKGWNNKKARKNTEKKGHMYSTANITYVLR